MRRLRLGVGCGSSWVLGWEDGPPASQRPAYMTPEFAGSAPARGLPLVARGGTLPLKQGFCSLGLSENSGPLQGDMGPQQEPAPRVYSAWAGSQDLALSPGLCRRVVIIGPTSAGGSDAEMPRGTKGLQNTPGCQQALRKSYLLFL